MNGERGKHDSVTIILLDMYGCVSWLSYKDTQTDELNNLSLTHLFIMLAVFIILIPRLPLKVKSSILEIFESFQYGSAQTVYSPDGETKHAIGI